MKYKITITKIEEVTSIKVGDWRVLDTRPWTDEEMSGKARRYVEEDFLEQNPLKSIMGNAPGVEVTESKETQILAQTVDKLDIAAVIKAVNEI